MSTTFTAQEANREYPDAEITLEDWAIEFVERHESRKNPREVLWQMLQLTPAQLDAIEAVVTRRAQKA